MKVIDCTKYLILTLRISVFYFCIFNGFCNGSECNIDAQIMNSGPRVETKSGIVIGKYLKVSDADVAAFLGIPYAKPPIGEKRFEKAEPIRTWKGALFANKKSPSCMQQSSRDYPWIPSEKNVTEDCLYLNVWVPVKCRTFNLMPVMVFIHGGGFYSGSSSMDVYNGSVLSFYGDVVVVSINYRLGIFGFLNVGLQEAPGNVGLFDQVLALQWIKENIQQFRGDPNSITLFGESAGSMSINLHLVSPSSRGLFHKVIMQSGVAYHPHLVDGSLVSMFKAKTFAELIGCSTEVGRPSEIVECLKKKDAAELAQVESTFTAKFPVFFSPSFGNEFLPENPLDAVRSGQLYQVPMLIGNNNDEGTIFLTYVMPNIFSRDHKTNLTLLQAQHIIRGLFSSTPEVFPETVFNFYFRNVTEDGSEDIVKAISNAYGDYVFNCPTMFFAEKVKEAYMYWNTYRSHMHKDDEWLGVPHFIEVPFVFGKPIIKIQQTTEEDIQFSASLIHKWASFARSGNPLSTEGQEPWLKFTSTTPVAYELNPRCECRLPHPRLEACDFWRPYIETQLK